MNIVGLITEYNPFHKGHEYHIKKAKELTGADACVVIMSGNYVQRGTPAFMDKHTRTSIALAHGADIIFELPVPFSCASAEYFATAAVTLLHKMGVITHICFGAECDDIDTLGNVASVLADAKYDNSHPVNQYIKENVKGGMSYASARSNAVAKHLGNDYASLLDTPNNILALEYLKVLKLLHSDIVPVAITRTKASYHDSEANDRLYSASSIRNAALAKLANTTDNSCDIFEELYSFSEEYRQTLGKTAPVTEDDFSNILCEKLLSLCLSDMTDHALTEYIGIDNDLANRIANREILLKHTSFSSLTEALKTKNIAYTSVSRALLAVTLGITGADVEAYINNGISSYIRLLGFKKDCSAILNNIKKKGALTIIGQLSEISGSNALTALDMKMLSHSIYCDELYNMIVRYKYKCEFPNEYKRKIIVR